MKNKEKINSVVFFSIVYWISIYLAYLKPQFSNLTLTNWLIVIIGFIAVIFAGIPLTPVFRTILKLTAYIGTFIFLILSIVIFYFVLTPMSFIMRIFGKVFVTYKIDKSKESYFCTYDQSDSADNMY